MGIHFDVVNLENVKSEQDIKRLRDRIKQLEEDPELADLQALVLVVSPRSLALDEEDGWCPFFVGLAKSQVLRLILIDEAHLMPQHGLNFRLEEYKIISEKAEYI